MTFRAIQPANSHSGASENDTQQQYNNSRLPKYHNAVQACEDCRKAKIKCNEERPRCGSCIRRNLQCGYKTDNRKTLISATKSRLESLEQLFNSLRTSSPDQADQLLRRIRMNSDFTSIVNTPAKATPVRLEPAPVSRREINQSIMPTSLRNVEAARNAEATVFPLASSSTHDLPPPSAAFRAADCMQHTTAKDIDLDANHDRSLDLTASMDQLSSFIQLRPPDASVTAQALDSFFSCSGKLFHVFKRDEIMEYFHDLFDTAGPFPESRGAKVGCVMAVAAVGAQYLSDKFSKEVRTSFYKLARQCFDTAIEEQPLHAVKICTLLAQYNILDKEMVALAYVEVGLTLSRVHGLDQKSIHSPEISESCATDLQKTWRTLVFFSSWLSSTLGYISGNNILSERQLLTQIQASDSSDIADMIQIEMVKICILKADILRMKVAFKELTIPAMQSIRKDLQKWYQDLPDVMHIETSGNADLALETRRSILHVHLLYLGAVILLYRRLAFQFVQLYVASPHENSLPIPLHGLMVEQGTEAVLAASTSARILKLLLEDNSIFKRCWLVIFQAYTTGTILLHAAIQKQLHKFNPQAWQGDLERAEDCLAVLAFCGTDDPVAVKFYRRLEAIYKEISPVQSITVPPSDPPEASPAEAMNGFNDSFNVLNSPKSTTLPTESGYLLNIPAHAERSRVNLTLNVLAMLSQPFGDLSDEESAESRTSQHWLRDPTRYEYPQMVERLDQNYEKRIFSQWDSTNLKFPILATPGTGGGASQGFSTLDPKSENSQK